MAGPQPDGEVTVIVVTWEGKDLALEALASLERQTIRHRVLVVDNASTDGTREAVAARFPLAKVLRLNANRGFAGGVAAALAEIDTRFVALLNNDAVADPAWLEESLALFGDPAVAAVTAKILLSQATPHPVINNAGVVLLHSGYGADRGLGDVDMGRYAEVANVFGFSGGAAVLRTLAVKAVGGFRDDYFMYYEDTELSWRLRLAGWQIRYCPRAVVTHIHGASAGPGSPMFATRTEGNRLRMLWSHAPVTFAAAATARFAVTTASLTVQRLSGRPPVSPVLDSRLRWRLLGSVLTEIPRLLIDRWGSGTRRDRQRVFRHWRGVPARTLQS